MPTEKAFRSKPRKRRSRGVRVIGTGSRIALSLFLILFVAMTIMWPDSVYAGLLGPDGLVLDARF